MLDNWQRIEKIVKWTGLSVNAFAREIGLNRSENLYQIKRGNNGISRELAEIICEKYSTISKAWLLTGEGEMFIEKSISKDYAIPFYRTDVVKFIASGGDMEPTCNLYIPLFPQCDFAALSLGRSMAPEIPPGAMVMCKKCEDNFFLPGEDYLVISKNFSGIRSLRSEPESDMIRLVPRNKEEYDEIIIRRDDITALYSIQGMLIDKSI